MSLYSPRAAGSMRVPRDRGRGLGPLDARRPGAPGRGRHGFRAPARRHRPLAKAMRGPRKSPRPSGWPARGSRPPGSIRAPSGCGSTRWGSNRRRPRPSLVTRPPDSSRLVVVDLCAGIGGDTLALARRADVLAVDLDHGMCRRIAWNAARLRGRRSRPPVPVERRDAFPSRTGRGSTWIPTAGPPGRAGRRSVADYSPGLDFLRSLVRRSPGGAIKLSPASDFAMAFPLSALEIELISLDGECKEATVWFGAAASCRRRATRLPELVTWTDRDGAWSEFFRVPVSPVSSYVYDPDPALLRSGLLDSFAAAHGLARIAADVDYLTGGPARRDAVSLGLRGPEHPPARPETTETRGRRE